MIESKENTMFHEKSLTQPVFKIVYPLTQDYFEPYGNNNNNNTDDYQLMNFCEFSTINQKKSSNINLKSISNENSLN